VGSIDEDAPETAQTGVTFASVLRHAKPDICATSHTFAADRRHGIRRFRAGETRRTRASRSGNPETAYIVRAANDAEPARKSDVDKNRTEGMKHEVKGSVKEVAGKITGNPAKEVAGNIEKNAGKVQREVGKATDRARDKDRHH
jgi:uncharacterized protein YjbJ (UPF0337 family)